MNANPRTRLQRSRIVLSLGIRDRAERPVGVRTQSPQVANVLVVTMDGMRWQEVFGGIQKRSAHERGRRRQRQRRERSLARFDAPTAEQRREKLMPFFWGVIARQGQVFGDPAHQSVAHVTNGLWFSYPGYNELLTGFADPRVDSNDRNPNPNVTVLEWLNHQPAFAGRVAAFASWELLPWILNQPRSGIPSNGDGPPIPSAATERDRAIDEFAADLPPVWGETRFDAPTGLGALAYLHARHPRSCT